MKYQVNDEVADRLRFWYYSTFVFVVFFVFVTVVYVSNNRQKYEVKEMLSEVVVENIASSEAKLSDNLTKVYKVKVLNTTGVSGLASEAVSKIKAEGVVIESVTGNAEAISGVKAVLKSEALKSSRLAQIVTKLWPNAVVKIDVNQEEEMVLVIGK